MPTCPERPRLRPYLAAARDKDDPNFVFLWDQRGLTRAPQRLTMPEYVWAQMFDGRRDLQDIQAEGIRRLGGVFLPLDWLTALVSRLDDALLLDGPRFRGLLANPVREPSCLGCYSGEPQTLRRQLRSLFTDPGGPGVPEKKSPDGTLRAALLPHIDFARGGVSYGWGFKEVFERTDASLFVIIGTSHHSAHRYMLTRKHFKTPLGITPTDQDYIDRLVAHYGDGLFDDEAAHLPEHSIELEVVLLQYLYESTRPIRIVPLLVGPFQDCVLDGSFPAERGDIGRMIESLRHAEASTGEPICYIISGDLAHIGPKFGDPEPVEEPLLSLSRQRDLAIIQQAEAADANRYFSAIADEGDRRRICGLPPTYTFLQAAQPSRGRVLHYDQYVHPQGFESVSFASMAFYQ